MKDLIIVGAGGFGRELLNVIEAINAMEPTWNVLGFLDDNPKALDGFALEYTVLGSIADWKPIGVELYALGIANPKTKERVVPILKEKGAEFAVIIAPTASVSDSAQMGEGTVLFGYAGISVNVKVGNYVFLNSMAGIGHDAVIGDYCTFGPKVCICGKSIIGKCVNVGTSASIYPGIQVGDYATIGMNSAVIRRVKPMTTVMGVPAKIIY